MVACHQSAKHDWKHCLAGFGELGNSSYKLNTVINPYSLPAEHRVYFYYEVLLALEIQRLDIISELFSKKTLGRDCGIYVLKLDKLTDVQRHDQGKWLTDEFLIFYNKGKGYECLFKRLRDTFAHGHYEQRKRGWITIRHRYKDPHKKVENTRAFGNLKITTLKKLITFLDKAKSDAI